MLWQYSSGKSDPYSKSHITGIPFTESTLSLPQTTTVHSVLTNNSDPEKYSYLVSPTNIAALHVVPSVSCRCASQG